ncbi:hypothetical protein [Paractinoplanes hotanensis]|uniref:PepSY domain-containing protein n=1 Tax=Paractinoplanes hotanensis TaxID=2906497 RepID=A0ABT0XXE8_9ACTN|nr:hypothetical protein [Actinoplanes hotanensis]MCM4078402.1 hypothetical protein [Actinoplanes hotanensis]
MTLERRYHRLLLAYPGPYRRGHGTEIVTTLLEMAPPGQTRPSASDVWHLFRSGLRQRFRLPSGRPLVWVAAVLITVVTGAFGAAAGSWVAEQTFTDLPGDAGIEALTRHAAGGGGGEFGMDRSASPWWTTLATGGVDAPSFTPEAAQARLTADGWSVTAIRNVPMSSFTEDPVTGATIELSASGSVFEATRDGLTMQVSGHVTPEHGTISAEFWPADTGAMRPLMLAGAALGLIAGWLLTASGAYRMRALSPGRRRSVAVLTGLALVTLALPALALWVNVGRVLRPTDRLVWTVHSAFHPGPYWSYGPKWMVLELAVVGLVLAAGAWVLLLRRHPAPAPVTA